MTGVIREEKQDMKGNMKKSRTSLLAVALAVVFLLSEAVSFIHPAAVFADDVITHSVTCRIGVVGEHYVGGPWFVWDGNDDNDAEKLKISDCSGLPEGVDVKVEGDPKKDNYDAIWYC